MEYVLPLQRLIEKFCTLKGVGYKTAVRYAFSVLDMDENEAEEFANAIISAKRDIHPCRICGNHTADELCNIFSDKKRDNVIICVVEDSRTVMALEKVREYDGLYHVLGGVISPMDNVGPENLRIKELLERIKTGDVREVIIATNPNIEGETTAMYISKLLKPLGIKISRLAYGIPVGGDLQYADEVTLSRALKGRNQI